MPDKQTTNNVFNVSIIEPEDLSVLSKVSSDKQSISLTMSGSSSYAITLNGSTFKTSENNIQLELKTGVNIISVKGDKDCQGKYEETILSSRDAFIYPNPITSGHLNIYLGSLNSEQTKISIYSVLGNRIYTSETNENTCKIDMSQFSKGMYILNLETPKAHKSFKIIKR